MEPYNNLSAVVEVKCRFYGSAQSVFVRGVVVVATDLEYYSHNHSFISSRLIQYKHKRANDERTRNRLACDKDQTI